MMRLNKLHRFMSDWKRGSVVILAACTVAYFCLRSERVALRTIGIGIFGLWWLSMMLFGNKWIAGRPEDFPDDGS